MNSKTINSFGKALIALFAAIDVVFYIATPLIVASLLSLWATGDINNVIINVGGLMACFYRAIKIGFLKE